MLHQPTRTTHPSRNTSLAGFTTIELLLYAAITAVIGSIAVLMLYTIIQFQVKNQTVAEVEQSGYHAASIITQTIRNATAVNNFPTSSTSSTLSLQVRDAAKSPTVFHVATGTLQITEGAGASVSLTPPNITVASLEFTHASTDSTTPSIQVRLRLHRKNPLNSHEYNYNQLFPFSANIRP